MLTLDEANAAVVALSLGRACNLCGARMKRTTCMVKFADNGQSGVDVACTREGCKGTGVELLP